MTSRFPAVCRTVLLGVFLVALLVSPASAGPRQALPDPVVSTPQKQYLPLIGRAGRLPTSIDLIDAALAGGQLDEVTALVYKVYAVFGDPRLPAQYHGYNKDINEGTQIMSEAMGRYDALPATTQALLLPFLLPPQYAGSWDDQQPAEGPAVAPAPLTAAAGALPAGATLAPDAGLPEMPLSEKWFSRSTDRIKVWGRADRPGERQRVDYVLSELNSKVWILLAGLMERTPIKDDGQKNNGGDGRLDVVLTDMADRGLALPYVGFNIMSPVHIRIARNLAQDDLNASLAHQFMHALQFTYQLPGNRMYDRWLMQSTAVWAEDYVYPNPNTEQRFLDNFLDAPGVPLNDTAGGHHYGAYLFPFYLSHRYNASLIRLMWEATERTNTALEAVNSVIPGGFKEQWPEFARYNWNLYPQDDYNEWDDVPRGVYSADMFVPEALPNLPYPSKDFVMDVPTDVRPLAAYYFHFIFERDDVSSVAFQNPFKYVTDPAAKVQVLVKIAGAWQEVQDWTTTVGTYSYCRDARAGRVEELVIILSNSNWQDPNHVLKAYQPMRLVATNVGCWRWRGTTRSDWAHKEAETIHAKAEVLLQRYDPAAQPNGNPGVETFDTVSGTAVAWVTTTPGAHCTYWSETVTTQVKPTDGYISVHTADTGPLRRLYFGSGATTFDSNIDFDCGRAPTSEHLAPDWPWQIASFLATGGTSLKWFVSADGRTMEAITDPFRLDPDSDSTMITSEWHFIAEREP